MKSVLLTGAALLLMSGGGYADDSLSVTAVDARTLRIQEKVEALFAAGEYDRAYFIYENELAPVGDKYAQYMLGYMHLIGAGVQQDRIRASAWYRMAAERGKTEFVGVRDELWNALSEADRGRSDEVYRQLRQKYSDIAVVFEQVEADVKNLTVRTGSRLPGGSQSLTVVNPSQRTARSGDNYYKQIDRRLDASLQFLVEQLDLDEPPTKPEDVDLDELRRAVNEYLERVE
ncbi:MAG: SEL1-like repeat protein [Pseudomonadota bacterium]